MSTQDQSPPYEPNANVAGSGDLRHSSQRLHVAPITLAEANAYIASVHRHNGGQPSLRLAAAIYDDENRVRGVATAGLPKARMLAARGTLEVTRVGTDGVRNGCSLLYGAMTRAAKALGYRRLITYTLEAEPGASLRASGWTATALSGGESWARRQASKGVEDYEDRHDTGPKIRWEIRLGEDIPPLIWPVESEHAPPTLFDAEEAS